ncbi:type I restriction endonuclease [Parageobacillus toebii]|uniref:type I site-specific deoxyribonuclease n=1 Tax=Parageobacillus toebii TaxID=153151 RepID=A0A150N1I6_9BACL|nr:type I restriction endonuclease [Parageobacillus toebii]KYD30548.1 Type I restriction-modification system, restriction subunit R [Parageobacillus toebii]
MFVEHNLNLKSIFTEQGFNYYVFKDMETNLSVEGILTEEFVNSITKINPFINKSEAFSLMKEKFSGTSQSVFTNKTFIKTLQEGLPKKINGKIKNIRFIDLENLNNNQFSVIEEYRFEKNGRTTIVDFVLCVNGLPIITIEKTSAVEHGFMRLKRYMEDVPIFAICELFSVITDGITVRYAMISDFAERNEYEISSIDTFVKEILTPISLLELIKDYTIFLDNNGVSRKFIFKDYQRRAISKTIHKLITTTEKRVGIINQQFGTGQTLTLLHLARNILTSRSLNSPKVLIVTDRISKSEQLLHVFHSTYGLTARIAKSSDDLHALLHNESVPIIFTTVQKFREEYKIDEEIIVIIDNCHRTQTGSFALNMRNAIPNARIIGITSLTVTKKIKQLFGEIIEQFTIEDAIQRGLMLPVYYENRVDFKSNLIVLDTNEETSHLEVKKKAFDIINHFNSHCQSNSSKALLITKNRLDAIRYKAIFDEINHIEAALYISAHQHDSQEIKRILENKNEVLQRFCNEEGNLKILITCSAIPASLPFVQIAYLDKFISENLMQEIIGLLGMRYKDKQYGLIVDYDGRNNVTIIQKIKNA